MNDQLLPAVDRKYGNFVHRTLGSQPLISPTSSSEYFHQLGHPEIVKEVKTSHELLNKAAFLIKVDSEPHSHISIIVTSSYR